MLNFILFLHLSSEYGRKLLIRMNWGKKMLGFANVPIFFAYTIVIQERFNFKLLYCGRL